MDLPALHALGVRRASPGTRCACRKAVSSKTKKGSGFAAAQLGRVGLPALRTLEPAAKWKKSCEPMNKKGCAAAQLGRVDLPALRTLDVRGASLARQRPSPVPGFEVTWLLVAAVVAGCPRLRALAWTRQHWDRLQCQALGCALPATLERITVQVLKNVPSLHHVAG